MTGKKIKIRPFHIWWLGIVLFGPSLIIWITCIILFSAKGMFDCPFDWYGIRHIYLPLFAAFVGFSIPVICLRVLRRTRTGIWGSIFVIYLVVMLTWGIVDIRYENCQIGGHRYPHGPLIDGHRYYFHIYFTWYFLPYRWIEKGIDDTTITFQNNSGALIQINAQIIEVEQDDFEWKYESEIKNGNKDTLEVVSGIKYIKYTIDQTEGEIEFDMWSGEDVILVINNNKKIETDYKVK